MFGRDFHIGTALGMICLSFVSWICIFLFESFEYEEETYVIIIMAIMLIGFMVNGIALILRKPWALLSSIIIISILSVIFILVILTENDGDEYIYDFAGIVFALLFTTGSILLLNSNLVKKEFNQEIIYDDLDDILDA